MEDNKNNKQILRDPPGEKKKFFWVLLVFVLIIGIWIGVQGANQGVLTLATSAQGLTKQDGNIKVRIRAIDAQNVTESLYTIDQTAVVKDGQLKLRWQIPPTAKKKSAYIEICAMDKRAGPSADVKKSCIEKTGDVAYNKVSCPYYVPANSTGFSGQLNGWNKLDDSQKFGCNNDRNFSKVSSLQTLASTQSPGIQVDGGGVLVAENGKIEAKDVEEFVKDALSGAGGTVVQVTGEPTPGPQGAAGANGADGADGTNGADGAVGIATVSGGGLILTGQNLSLDDSCLGGQILQWDGSNWGCASVAGTDSQTLSLAANVLAISGGNSVNLAMYLDNTDSQALSWVGGTRTLSLTGGGSVVISDSDTTYSAGNGLSLGGTTFSINSPTCAGTTKLTWNGTAFSCAADVDTDTDTTNFNVAANGGAGQNISAGGTVNFTNGTGTTASRSGSDISFGLTNTAVTGGTYSASNNANGSLSLPQFTVDAQGRLTAASTSNVTLTGIANSQLTNSAITINTTGPLAGGGSVSLGGSLNLSLDLSDAGDSATATTSSGSGLEISGNEVGLLRGCSSNQLLKWNSGSLRWECATDTDTDTNSGGTVTGITAGTGLTGGTITTSGTINIATTGVTAATYGSSTSIPVITVNAQGQITAASSSAIPTATTSTTGLLTDTDWDTFNGKENVLTFTGNGLFSRSGNTVTGLACSAGQIPKWTAGTFACGADDNSGTTYSAGNGLSLGGTTFSINSPTCAGTDKLTWSGTAFSCASDVDTDTDTTNFNVAAAGTVGSQNITSGGTVTFGNGTGTTATRSGSTVTYGLNNTAVSAGTYSPSDNANGSLALPQFTVDAQGRLTAASTTNVTLTGIANSQLANSAITVNTAGGLTGGSSVSLGGSINLSLDLSDAGDTATASTNSGSGLEVSGGEIGLIRGCSNTQLLKWNSSSLRWECASDTDTNSGGTVTSVTAGTGLSGGTITSTGTIDIANTGVTAASYGSSTSIPVITVNAQGQITAASSTAIPIADTSTTGLLTDTDWDTFNGKENVLTFNGNGLFSRSGNTVTGLACIAGEIPKWTAGAFACGADAGGASYSAGNGLSLGGSTFSINSPTCSGTDKLQWTGTAFTCSADVDTGVTSVGTIDSQTKSANGAVISGTSLVLQTADGSNPGLVSTGTQTFAGAKTFSGSVNANGDVTLGDAAADGITITGEIRGASPLAFEGATNDGVYTTFAITDPTLARTITFPDASGTVCLQGSASCGFISVTLNDGQILVGNGSNVATAVTPSGDVTISNTGVTTIGANSVALGTDTTGNYVAGNTAGNGISVSGSAGEGWSPTISINAPTCAGTDKLTWNGTAFSCASDVDTDTDTTNFNVAAQGTVGSQNIASGDTVTFNNGTGTTATRSGSTVTYGLNNTAVSAGTYSPSDNANGSLALPQFTVDAQGRLTAASTTNVTLTGIANSQLTNSAITVNTAGGLTGGSSVSLGGSINLSLDLSDSGDTATATTNSGSGLEVSGGEIGLIRGCSSNQLLKWNSTSLRWECASDVDTDTDTGVTSVGTIDSQTKSANGAVISGTVVYLQTADASNPGLVSTGTQTFAGDKTFSGNVIANGNLTANGDVTLGNAATDGLTFTGEVRGASPLVFEGVTNDGVYTTFAITDPTLARTVTFPDRSGTVSLSGDTFTGDVTGTLNASGATTLTIAANSVALGTDTTGDYVSNVTAGGGLTGTATGEGSTPTLAIVSSNGGIVVNADDIALTITASANALSSTTSSGSGLEILSSGLTLLQGCSNSQLLKWNETTDVWECAADVDTDTDTGVTSVGTIDSQTKSANGAVISGTVVYLQTADASAPGLVSTGTQTFAGDKTFNGNVIAGGNLTANGDVTLGNAATDAITFTGEVRGASPLAFEGATNDGVYTTFAITDPTLARTVTFPDRSGTVSLSGDTFTGDVTGTLNASGATTLTIAANSVALGTDTTGDYVSNVTAGGGLTGSATGEGSTPTLAIVSSNGGIVVNADDIALTIAASANALSATTSSGSGLEILASGLTLLQGCSDGQLLKWNETTDVWECSADTDTDTGVTTIGTIDSQTKSANGAVISGNTLYLQTADATNVGLVSTGTQTFAGDKTFSGNIIASGNLTANGDVTLGNAATDGLTFTGEIRGASPLAFEGATNDGVYTTFAITDPTLARTITFPDRSGTVSLSGDTFTGDVTGTLNASGATTLTIAANSVALGTDTTGDYVANVTAGGGLTGSATGEGSTPTLAIVSSNGGIVVNADDIALTIAASANALSSTTSSGSGLEILASGLTLLQGCSDTQILKWNETTDVWACSADVDTDTGVTSIGTIDSQTKSANGAVISGSVIYLQTADASNVGLVSTGTQTFAGNKTFNGNVIADANLTVNGDIVLGNAATDAITFTGEVRGASPLVFEGATNDDIYTTFAITDPTLARTITFPDRSGTVSLSGDTFTGDVTGTLNASGATTLTIAANSVALGTDTTGDYVTNVTAGGGLTGSATGEGSTPTLAVVSSNGGIIVNTDDIALTIAASADALSATTSSGSGLEILSTGLTLLQGCSDGQLLKWNETTDVWGCSADIDTDTGVTTIGTLDSLTKSANGAVISGNTLVLQTADATMPGLVSTGTQTFAGDKTFTGLVTANGGLTIEAGDTFTMNGDAFTDLTGSGLTISGGALTVDASTATGFFRNGGNTFGAAATLGTNDSNVLNIETNGTNRFQFSSSASTLTGQGATTLTSTGSLTLSSAAASDLNINSGNNANITANSTTVLSQNDSASAFQVQTSLASPLFNVDASTASTIVYSPYDSATAFQVQDSASRALLNVDAATGSTTVASGGSTTALQVLNGSGDQLMNVDTTNIINNLIANPSFEVNDTGWAYIPGYVDTTQAYVGKSSLRVDTTSSGDGAMYDVASLASDTSYTLSFYAKAGSGNYEDFTSLYAGYYDGTSDTDCLTSQTVSSSGWTRYSCTFTTGTTSGVPNIYMRQNDSTDRAFYIDGVQLIENTLPSSIITGTNSTFESGIGSWSGYSGSSPTQSSAQAHMGTYSGRMITSGGGNENGISLGVSGLVSASTTYTIKAYIKADASSTPSTYQLGHTLDNGQVLTSRNGCNIVTPTSSTWKVLTCTFTTASSLRGAPYITLTQTNNLSTATTTYIDSVSMYAGSDAYGTDQGFTMGRISLNGAIESPTLFQNASNSTTAFQIQGANSSHALFVADTLNNRIGIGKNTAAYTLDVEGIINASSSVITPSLTSLAGTALTIDSGTTGAINIGTGANAKTITIGNATGATSTVVNCGTGACSFGANATAHTTTLGSATGAANTVVQAGTGGLTLGSSGVANTIQIGNTTGAVSQTINIGTNATASSTNNVNIGSTVAGTTAIAGPTTITGRTSGSSSTLVVNNSTSTGAIFTAQDNGTAVLTIANNGGATFKTVTNTANAFKTTNSNNDVLLNVGTAHTLTDYTNMLNNSSFESGSTGWSSKSGGSMGSSTGGGSVTGISYLSIGMDAVGEGTYYSVTLSPNTDYTFSVYARTFYGAMNTLVIGHQDLFGSDIDDCVLSGDTIDASWHRVSCTFTTGASTSNSNVYIKQSDATSRSVDYDAAQLQASASVSAYNMGEVYFNAPINQNLIITGNGYADSNDLTFQVQDAAGALQFGVSAGGQVTVENGLAVNGGDLTSTATTFNFLQSNVTELNIGAAVGSSGINLAGGSGSTGCTINGTVGSLTCSGNITSTATSGILGWWTRSGTTLQPGNSGDNITTSGNISTTGSGNITSAGGLQVDGNTTLGDAATDTILAKGSMIANGAATGTTDTTSGTGTNTTTVTIAGTAFSNGDVILIDNAGQDYYTRVTAGGGTSSLTVSPAVTFETSRTVTKYNVQNIGATDSDYTTQSNRFFQGYFLGGVVTGAGSTTLSDGRLHSTVGLNFDAPSYTFTNSSNSTSAFRVNRADGENLVKFDTATTENLLSNGNFESNTTGWAAHGSSTVSQTGSQYYLGTGSMSVATTAAANDGAKFNYALASQTNYTMTFYVKNSVSTSSVSTINIGRSEDGSTDTNCATAQTINGAGWSKLTCTFTTGNVTGTDYIYIKQTDATARTLYVDSVQLQTSSNIATNPDIEVNTTGWGYYGSPTLSQTTSQFYTGAGSLQVDTSTSASSEGPALNTFTAQPNTTYTFSAMVMLDAGTGSNKSFSVLKNFDSLDSGSGTSCTSASLTPGTWTNMTCTFTTNSVATASSFISINVTDDGVTPITFYVDNVSLAVTKWNSNDIGRISLNGAIDSPLTVRGAQDSASALQVQQQNGKNVLTVDTLNGRVGIGADAPTKTLQVDGKALIRATSSDTDTFQVTNTAIVGTANSVIFNVAGSSRVVSAGLSTNTTNTTFNVYGTQLINTKANSASAFRIQDASGVTALSFATTSGNRKLQIGGTGTGNDGKIGVASSAGDTILDIDSTSNGLAYLSVDDFQVNSFTSGNPMITADGTTGYVGIGMFGAAYPLDVIGDINSSTGYRIAGTAGASTTCSGGQFLQNQVVVGGLTTGGTCAAVSGSGVTTVGTFSGSSQTNGASISGTTITFGPADGTNPGMVTTGTQTFAGNKTFNGDVEIFGSSINLGNNAADTITATANLRASNSATATTDTTNGTGTNTTTLTITGTAFANNDVILIDNAGQDYYTRVVSGGGTSTLTVSPAITFENARTVTKYNIQNIGATPTDYTTTSNRFFQGYFLGGVVTGAGTTSLSDGLLYSSGTLNINASAINFNAAVNFGSSLLTDIGDTGTDFTSGGGLTLAGTLVANGALTVNTCTNTSTNVLCDGGNTRAGNITLGTNDTNALIFETDNTARGRFTSTGELLINTTTNTLNSQVVINSTAGKDTGLNIIGNVNSFYQLNIQNTNSGSSSSSDFVATADNGTATTNYVDFGINGSTGGAAPFTGANDAYLYASDSNNLHIGALGSSGAIKFYTTGGTGAPSLKLTLDSLGAITQTATSTTGTAYALTANSLTSGNGLTIGSTATGLTGNLFSVTSASTGAFSNGGIRYNFTGAHTGVGVKVDDATTTGTVYQINASALTTGTAFEITGPSAAKMLRVKNDNTQSFNQAQLIVGEGEANNPDSLARDQLYVFGRINTSWNQMWTDCLTSEGTKNAATTATGVYGAAYSGSATTGRLAQNATSGVSGVCRFSQATPAANATTYFGSGGASTTERSLNPVFEARVMSDNNTDHRNLIGFTDMAASTAITADTNNSANEAFFRKTAAGTSWETVTRSASGTEQVNTNVGSTTSWHRLRIEMDNGNAAVRFYVDGTLVATHTTAAPTAAMGFTVANAVTSTTSRNLDVDYLRVWSDDPPASVAPGSITQDEGLDATADVSAPQEPEAEDNSNDALLARIQDLETDVADLKQYKDVLTTEMLGDASSKKAVFISDVEFRNQVEFSADALFKANVNVDGTLNANGRVVVSNNTGTVTVQPGQTEIQVLFTRPLITKPNVFVSTENPDVRVVAQSRTANGFIIKLSEPITTPLDVQWFAVEKE